MVAGRAGRARPERCDLTALPEGVGQLAGLRKLDLDGNDGITTLPAALGLYGCSKMDNLLGDLWIRLGLPALLAHLATQGQAVPTG